MTAHNGKSFMEHASHGAWMVIEECWLPELKIQIDLKVLIIFSRSAVEVLCVLQHCGHSFSRATCSTYAGVIKLIPCMLH